MDKKQFQIEYVLNTSHKVLYNRLSTPSGLAEWFADDVNVENNFQTYIFMWDGVPSKAHVIAKKDLSYIRFRWEEDEDNTDVYFEFKIVIDELTKDLSLMIIDFAEPDEIADATQLWDTQIVKLKHVLGS